MSTSTVPGFIDRLGDRVVVSDGGSGGETFEVLRLRPELTADPAFGRSLQSRAEQIAAFSHRGCARVRRVARLKAPDSRLALVCDWSAGWRLSEILEAAEREKLTLQTDTVLPLLSQLVSALVALHAAGPDVSHGAVGPERILVTPSGRLLVLEYVLGSAFEHLPSMATERLWKDLRLAVPVDAKPPRFGPRTDLLQVGLTALAMILGRQLRRDEYPAGVRDLIQTAIDSRLAGTRPSFRPVLRDWLSCATGLDREGERWTMADAQRGLALLMSAEGRLQEESGNLDELLHAVEQFYAAGRPTADSEGAPAASAPEPVAAPTGPSDAPAAVPATPAHAEPAAPPVSLHAVPQPPASRSKPELEKPPAVHAPKDTGRLPVPIQIAARPVGQPAHAASEPSRAPAAAHSALDTTAREVEHAGETPATAPSPARDRLPAASRPPFAKAASPVPGSLPPVIDVPPPMVMAADSKPEPAEVPIEIEAIPGQKRPSHAKVATGELAQQAETSPEVEVPLDEPPASTARVAEHRAAEPAARPRERVGSGTDRREARGTPAPARTPAPAAWKPPEPHVAPAHHAETKPAPHVQPVAVVPPAGRTPAFATASAPPQAAHAGPPPGEHPPAARDEPPASAPAAPAVRRVPAVTPSRRVTGGLPEGLHLRPVQAAASPESPALLVPPVAEEPAPALDLAAVERALLDRSTLKKDTEEPGAAPASAGEADLLVVRESPLAAFADERWGDEQPARAEPSPGTAAPPAPAAAAHGTTAREKARDTGKRGGAAPGLLRPTATPAPVTASERDANPVVVAADSLGSPEREPHRAHPHVHPHVAHGTPDDRTSKDRASSSRSLFGVADEGHELPEETSGGSKMKWIAMGTAAAILCAALAGWAYFRRSPAAQAAQTAAQSHPQGHEQAVAPAPAPKPPDTPVRPADTTARPPAVPPAAPQPAADPAAAPPVEQNGAVMVVSPVALDVSERGQRLGASGAPIAFTAGRHTIEVASVELVYKATQVVDVRVGRTTQFQVALPKGSANINATPWAQVFIDGQAFGETPLGNVALTIGPHQVVFRHPQLGELTRTLVVTTAGPARLSVEMKQ